MSHNRCVNIEQATGGYIVHIHRWENDNLKVEAIVCKNLQDVLAPWSVLTPGMGNTTGSNR